jgi:regulator of protease activity HflC (stomatin/prohibitin superfamily)
LTFFLAAAQVVSKDIRRILAERARYFNIVLEDVSITNLTFSKEYTAAVEAKQVAQQEAERAKFIVSVGYKTFGMPSCWVCCAVFSFVVG